MSDVDICLGSLFPPWEKIRCVSYAIARQVCHHAFRQERCWLNRCNGKGGLTEDDIDLVVQKMASYPDPLQL